MALMKYHQSKKRLKVSEIPGLPDVIDEICNRLNTYYTETISGIND